MKRLIDFDAAIQFQSTPSAWRVTLTFVRTLLWAGFQSTPSAWRVTFDSPAAQYQEEFQSTPSAWRVTLAGTQYPYGTGISIHTLRVEGDGLTEYISVTVDISIHTLRVEGDYYFRTGFGLCGVFQSTPSAWRVTTTAQAATRQFEFQSTPSAWRVTTTVGTCTWAANFNPHPPRGG